MKKIFPKEFSDLLNNKGSKLLANPSKIDMPEKIKVISNIIRRLCGEDTRQSQ